MSATKESTRQPLIYGISIVFTVVTFIVVGLRIFSRHIAKAVFWWDDWLLWFGSALALGINAGTMYGAHVGLGRHVDEVSEENIVKCLKVLLAIVTIYQVSMSAIKASLLVFYYRLFSCNKWIRWTVYSGLCFIPCWHIIYFFTFLFQCQPVSFFWNRGIPGGHCLDHGRANNNAISVSNAAFNMFTDCVCLAAPLPVIWKLRMSRLKRSCLTVVFLLGGLDIVISGVRLAFLVHGQTADVTWSTALPALWTVLELNIAAICASLPGTMPIISMLFLQRGTGASISPAGSDIYRGSFKAGISTMAFHDRFHRTPTDESAILHSWAESERPKEHGKFETDEESGQIGFLELRDRDQGRESESSLPRPCRPAKSLTRSKSTGGILVTSNVEQKVEREWA